MKLTRTPRSIPYVSPVESRISGNEFYGKVVDIRHEESIGRSITLTEILRVMPLKVEFYGVAPYAGVFRVSFQIRESEVEPKAPIKSNGRCDVMHHQDRVNRFESGCHGSILVHA